MDDYCNAHDLALVHGKCLACDNYVCDECRTAAYDDLGIRDADEQAEACIATGDLLGDHICEFRDDPDSEPCQQRGTVAMTKRFDVVDFIIAYEQGDTDEDETIAGFQHLIDSGTVWSLQGSYGRMAMALIEQGLCTLPTTRVVCMNTIKVLR